MNSQGSIAGAAISRFPVLHHSGHYRWGKLAIHYSDYHSVQSFPVLVDSRLLSSLAPSWYIVCLASFRVSVVTQSLELQLFEAPGFCPPSSQLSLQLLNTKLVA